MSRLVRTEQVAFAATGDPGWTEFSGPASRTRVYRPEPTLVPYPEEPSRVLWRTQQFGVLDVLR